MSKIRNALFAAATLAAAFGTSAATTNADAGWGVKFGNKLHGFHLSVQRNNYYNSCWGWAWNGYQYVRVWKCGAY